MLGFSARQGLLLLFSFMIALLTVLLVVACVCTATVFSESYVVQRMDQTAYYANTAAVLRDQYANYGLPAGVEDAFFDAAIDEDGLYRHIRKAVKAAYAGETYTLDKQPLIDDLYQQLKAYATEKEIEITDEVNEGLTYLSDLCVSAYVKQADQVVLRTLGRYAHRLQPYMWVVIAVLTLLDGLCLWMVYRLSTRPHRTIRCWNSSLLGSAIMLLVAPGWLYLSKGVETLGITSPALKPLVVAYANNIFTSFLICGAVIIVAVLTIGIISLRMVKMRTSF